jgi:2,3-bisphosphoglycerate-dependent phosphoglycerate mutase
MTRLVIARHGQARCNVDRTIEGVATCRGLTELGRQQSMALANRLQSEDFRPDVVLASPIARARETAAILCGVIGGTALLDASFEEIRPGEAEGMTWDQYGAFYGTSEGWDPSVAFAPGAEAWSDFALRVGAGLDRVTSDYDGRSILVIAHGGVVDASLFHYFAFDPTVQSPIDFQTTNASLTEWERRRFKLPNDDELHRWRLCRYNDAAHVGVGATTH